ncbi:kinase-like domain-containing protein [Spinellus fusiger]|nr:kinase-like domain-containing protein [Spinellus fusiger]
MSTVHLSHFKLMRIVGRGTFGKVRIVEHREMHKLYALKYISKEECIHMDAVLNVVRERTILEQLDHPFLCRLRFAFQDNDYMYMVTDLMLGGDLHYHISRQTFSEDVLRLWFAELASAIKYLHFNRVVHRDVKPQNILMDSRGHVHLADFNVATHLHVHRLLNSSSGTAYYMAPEIYKGTGYNEAVDWWSLGVTLYECVYGRRPFEYETSDELRIAIRRGYVHYPTNDRRVSGECLAAIQGFLELDPSKRLGQDDAGWTALVRHPFFRSIDWRCLESKSLVPSFQPPSDQNNFEVSYDLEEQLHDPNSLSMQSRKLPRNKTPKHGMEQSQLAKRERDLQWIQEKFKNFDFTIFERYEGFKDPIKMTVGDPPDWVKPAFEGADQGDLLPIKRISTTMAVWQQEEASSPHLLPAHLHSQSLASHQEAPSSTWRGLNRAASTSHLSANGMDAASGSLKRRSLGTLHSKHHQGQSQLVSPHPPHSQSMTMTLTGSPLNPNSASLSEEYAMSLHGIRKKQSTRSFRERRERDRKSIVNSGMGHDSHSHRERSHPEIV